MRRRDGGRLPTIEVLSTDKDERSGDRIAEEWGEASDEIQDFMLLVRMKMLDVSEKAIVEFVSAVGNLLRERFGEASMDIMIFTSADDEAGDEQEAATPPGGFQA